MIAENHQVFRIYLQISYLKQNKIFLQAKEEIQMAKNNYMALNAQLLDELPKLYTASVQIVLDCIACLILAQKKYYHIALDEMYQLLGVSIIVVESVFLLQDCQLKIFYRIDIFFGEFLASRWRIW